MNDNKVIIFHHNDMDGKVSAALIYAYEYYYKMTKSINITCKEIDYTVLLNDDIKEGTTVYFVDYSFSKNENIDYLKSLINKGYKVIWIDHHKTSLEILYQLRKEMNLANTNFDCMMTEEKCATMICAHWIWEQTNHNKKYYIENRNFIKLVNSWDIWIHDMENDRDFNQGFMHIVRAKQYNIANIAKILNVALINNDDPYNVGEDREKTLIQNYINIGKSINEYLDISNADLCKKYGHQVKIIFNNNEYICITLNKLGNSTLFGDLNDKYDIVIPYMYTGIQYTYSLFTKRNNLDCSEIAKKLGEIDGLGGGGHAQAAGFQTYHNIFEKDVIEIK